MTHFHSLNKRLIECHNDKALLETYFRTTAQKIRAKIQRQRQVRERMTAAQKEKLLKKDRKLAEERELFRAAKEKEAGITWQQHQADLLVAQFNKNNPTPSEHKEGGVLPVKESERKASSGGRKTRRKRRRKKKKSRRKRKTRRRRKKRKTKLLRNENY